MFIFHTQNFERMYQAKVWALMRGLKQRLCSTTKHLNWTLELYYWTLEVDAQKIVYKEINLDGKTKDCV